MRGKERERGCVRTVGGGGRRMDAPAANHLTDTDKTK